MGVGNIVSVRPFLSYDFDFILKLFWHSWLAVALGNMQTTTIKAQMTKEGCVKNIGVEKDRPPRPLTRLHSVKALALSLFPPKNVTQTNSR